MNVKKYFVLLFAPVMLWGCEKAMPNEGDISSPEEMATVDAQRSFATILSKAVYERSEVREFLKEEALRQFDNDNDVFYPFVKDKVDDDGQTFREILLSYCDGEEALVRIEQALPLLNILVPDLSLFCDFNAESWDVADREVAILCRDDDENTLFGNGEAMGNLPLDQIPGFPCLVVKNNERLRATGSTRSGEVSYEFTSDVFDGSKNPQTRSGSWDIELEETETGEYVQSSEIDPAVLSAYEEFKGNDYAYDRDYIYYGITSANQPGNLNRNMREALYRFKILPQNFSQISDQEGEDPGLGVTTKWQLSKEELIKKIWTEGSFEIYFTGYVAAETDTEAMKHELPFSLKPEELFSIEKVHLKYTNDTWFRDPKSVYTVDLDNLHSRWVYPHKRDKDEHYVFIQPWELYNKALTIFLFVEERDDEQSIEETKTVNSEFAHKFDFLAEPSIGISEYLKIGAKLGYGLSATNSRTSSAKIITKVGSDDLGTLMFNYYDPVITSRLKSSISLNGITFLPGTSIEGPVTPMTFDMCKLYSVYNGSVVATLLPMKAK